MRHMPHQRFGLLYGAHRSPLYLEPIGHRGGDPGWDTAHVINGQWDCRIVWEGEGAPYVQCPRPHAWRQPILAVYFPPPGDPLPHDYNDACSVIEQRAKPFVAPIR